MTHERGSRAVNDTKGDRLMRPVVTTFFDEATNTATHVVRDPMSQQAAIVDPVLDYDPKSGRTATASADRIIEHVRKEALEIEWLIETHAHADHLSAAPYLKEQVGGRVAIGAHISDTQRIFRDIFNLGGDFPIDASQFDHVFEDGEIFTIGGLGGRVMHTPGHTPACTTYVIGDAAFVGDTLFMPDYGTARCDFPGGDARTLFRSIKKILTLPPETRIFLCHDYGAAGRDRFVWETTVAEEKASNVHVRDGVSEDDFVEMRETRDATLEMPTLLLPSVQVNIRAGHLPLPEDNGVSYLKIPLNAI